MTWPHSDMSKRLTLMQGQAWRLCASIFHNQAGTLHKNVEGIITDCISMMKKLRHSYVTKRPMLRREQTQAVWLQMLCSQSPVHPVLVLRD